MLEAVRERFGLLVSLCVLLSAVFIANVLSGFALNQYGILPRNVGGLWTIVVAPFIHGSVIHLINNLTGLVIFSALCLVSSIRRYLLNCLFIIVVGGLLVWLFGRAAPHIGASGLVFGLWSLCIASAWFERRIVNILIAVFVILFYGGLIYGILPLDTRVSFESHLFGVLTGFFCAYLNARGFFRTHRRRSR